MPMHASSFIIGILMLVVAFNLMKAPLGLALVVGTVGLLVAFWFIERGFHFFCSRNEEDH